VSNFFFSEKKPFPKAQNLIHTRNQYNFQSSFPNNVTAKTFDVSKFDWAHSLMLLFFKKNDFEKGYIWP
jgi:hypothetical protein